MPFPACSYGLQELWELPGSEHKNIDGQNPYLFLPPSPSLPAWTLWNSV